MKVYIRYLLFCVILILVVSHVSGAHDISSGVIQGADASHLQPPSNETIETYPVTKIPSPENDILTVFESDELVLERVGRNHDGGYIIALLGQDAYDLFLSGGVGDDTSFEIHFGNIHRFDKGYALDASIESPPPLPPSITWVKQFIGFRDDDERYNTLTQHLSSHRNVFLKLDIEGGEWEWFAKLEVELLRNIKQMTMEVHRICGDTYNDPQGQAYRMNVIKKLTQTHVLIWAHGNNYTHNCSLQGLAVPNALELTFVRKRERSTFRPNRSCLPGPKDMPNNPRIPDDIPLNFPPFRNLPSEINIAGRINPYSNVAFGKIKSSPEEESKLIDLLSNQIIDPPHVASHLECSTEKRNKFDVRGK